jgi:hypothetical protein
MRVKSTKESRAGLKLAWNYVTCKRLKTGKCKSSSKSLYPVSEAGEGAPLKGFAS